VTLQGVVSWVCVQQERAHEEQQQQCPQESYTQRAVAGPAGAMY
jgi:hypothetical protein